MILLEKLQEHGWFLTEEGLKKLTTSNNIQTEDVNKIISLALDWDLKDIAAGALPSKPDSNGTISGRIVLQIQKMRNISAPKANEESTTAPRFLQLELTDGVNTIAALELERIASLNLNVPPGTKLLIKAEKLKLLNGFLVLQPSDIQILGGKVEVLVEKWEVARHMLKYARSNRRLSGSGGPPPWIAFGKRLDSHKDALPTDRNFKSLQAASDKDKNSKENDEFNATRSQAIAEAAKAGQKKVFGGGQQNILDHNVKKILEKGYSEDDAKNALKTTNNNLERALYNLKRRNNIRSGSEENSTKPVAVAAGGRVRERGGIASAKEEAAAAKPQTNVSLFDFLTDKLPVAVSSSNTVQSQTAINNSHIERISKDTSAKGYNNNKALSVGGNRFENNMSSSFAANRATVTPRYEEKLTMQSRSNPFNQRQEERKPQFSNKIGRGGERNNINRTQPQSSNYDKPSTQQAAVTEDNVNSTGGNNNTKRNERTFKKEREQTPRQPISDYQSNKRNNEFNKTSEKKTYQSRENNRNNHQDSRHNTNSYQKNQTQKSNNFEKALDNLVESTSKMSIQHKDSTSNSQQSKGRNNQQTSRSTNHQQMPAVGQQQQKSSPENYTNNSQQQSSQFIDSQNCSSKSLQQNTKAVAYVPQVGNGFAYDPSKIMGFQSKEANEYAMNLLKSQGLTMQQLQQQQALSPQAQQATTLPPPPPQHSQNQILNSQATAAVAYMAQNPNLFVAPPQQAPPQFGMMSGGNWPWKIGDLCLAKYWDDGNYYDAKITAISDKTCVVLFLGYGNHEEVLKSDCLPITDAHHIPLNAYQANITAPPMSQPHPPAFQQRSNMHSGVGGGTGGNQRYRGERQMYVPPPKRNNN
ncbi:tudor domain-containing protein 3 [Calliphora vicina]|uniref:tudor domain-containing protein 3 n=1 Tax=Calliphora vicina TaxID=7373 RepID=UPI00325B53F8